MLDSKKPNRQRAKRNKRGSAHQTRRGFLFENLERSPGRPRQFERLEDRLPLALSLDISFDGDGFLTTDFGFGNDTAQAVSTQNVPRSRTTSAAGRPSTVTTVRR